MSDRIPVRVLLERIRSYWPEAASPETDIVFSVIRFHELIRMRTDEALRDFGLTHAAFEVLVALRAQSTPRQLMPTELYRSVLLSSGGTTKILIELERRGLIRRVPNPEDGRSKIVRLTIEGEKLVEQAMKIVMQHDREHFTQFDGKTDVAHLRDTLLLLMEKIESNPRI
ncbi:MarR family winged helix-turn-helix transcriptional regulator [Hoeflea sp. TYP-13]|uniref:MarR family winged helix-turn-helix transcriptional regulator n=1 Tax=Hoeflea sp. TYP-13 TaxID=3230023 RepID=UPI0034C682E4